MCDVVFIGVAEQSEDVLLGVNWCVELAKEAKAQAAGVLAFEAYQIRASGLTHRKTFVKGSC